MSAAGLSLGAVGVFESPAAGPVPLPAEWKALEEALHAKRLGAIQFAHLAYDAAHPLELWALLALLHAHGGWARPQRVSTIAASAPGAGTAPIVFIGTVEIDARTRVTVDARAREPRASAVMGSSDRISVPPHAGGIFGSRPTGARAAGHPYTYAPPTASGTWASEVCEALRESARRRGAVAFSEAGALIEAPFRVAGK